MPISTLTAALIGLGPPLALGLATSAFGQPSDALASFYKGKQIAMIIYSEAGGAYDLYGRLLARHMGKHIPGNPTLIPQNMPGAGGLKATEYLYGIAPKDGTVIGTISRGNPFEPMLTGGKANFDPLKFTWLGSMNREIAVALSWYTVPVKTIDDLKNRKLIVGGTGAGADSQLMSSAFNNLVGTKLEIIPGYRGSTSAALAVERGELEGFGYWSWSAIKSGQPGWIRDKKINIIFHTGSVDYPDLPGVPKIRDYAKNETDRQALELLLAREVLGRPFLAPPGLPPERAAALKAAFVATLKDPEFMKDANKVQADIEPATGEELEALLRKVLTYPAAVIERTKNALYRKQQ